MLELGTDVREAPEPLSGLGILEHRIGVENLGETRPFCNRRHRLDQRAARWLLQVDERVEEALFEVTQEFLAEMIGVQRPSLSLLVRQFKDDGLIRYTRGQIVVSDRDGLLRRACGCLDVILEEERRLRATPERYGIGIR